MNNFKSQWINQQRPRSVSDVNVDIFTCLERRELEERLNLLLILKFRSPFDHRRRRGCRRKL